MTKVLTVEQLSEIIGKARAKYGDDHVVTADAISSMVEEFLSDKELSRRVTFKYYLNDTHDHQERIDFIAKQIGVHPDHPALVSIGQPFYEVTLECELDTKTGEVIVTDVKL